ncbi:hypothetical protein JCM3775_007487 [Rhodotorula graminis]
MTDALLQFLLEEVAMDGDQGTSTESLAAFIADFYARSSSSSAGGAPLEQLVDDSFVSFVWDALVAEPDVRIGVLSAIDAPAAAHAEPQAGPSTADASPALDAADGQPDDANADDGDADVKPAKPKAKGKGKTKAQRQPVGPTHELRILDDQERALGRDALHDLYGAALRIVASEETARVAITGSHARISSITPIVYTVLQHVSRGRTSGVTAVRISKELGIDPKSVFHYIKVPQSLGIVKKFTDVEDGCRTNRIVHVRYLERSVAWRTHIAADEPDDDEGAGGVKDEDGGEGGGAGGGDWAGLEMPPISPAYLASNIPLIRARIVKAIRRRKDQWLPHIELHGSIGLHAMNPLSLRRLNAIVTQLAAEGVIEKVTVTRKKAGGKSSIAQALRLCVKREGEDQAAAGEAQGAGEGPAGGAQGSATQAQAQVGDGGGEDEADDEAWPRAGRPMERQILDLLMDADARGLTIAEISSALHSYSPRFVEATLQRLARVAPPVHLADYALHSMQETVGRMKQARWFSLVGYLAFRRARGFPDDHAEETYRALCGPSTSASTSGDAAAADDEAERQQQQHASRVGAFETAPGHEPAEGQHATLRDYQRRIDEYQVWAGTSAGIAATGGGKKRGRPAKVKVAVAGSGSGKSARSKGKGKERAVDDAPVVDSDATAAAAAGQDDGSASPAPPPVRRPTGRPRKHPLKPGEETYYMRRKREKAEDEERERQGLPPLVRAGKKKKKVKGEDEDEGAGDGAAATGEGEGDEGEGGEGKKGAKKGRKKGKGKEKEADTMDVDDESQADPSTSTAAAGPSTATTSSLLDPPPADTPAPKKKRGRPPKKAPVPEQPAATADTASPAVVHEPEPEPQAGSSAALHETDPVNGAVDVDVDETSEAPAPRRTTRGRKAAAEPLTPGPGASTPKVAAAISSTPAPALVSGATTARATRSSARVAATPIPTATPARKRTRAAAAAAAASASPPTASARTRASAARADVYVELDASPARKRARTESTALAGPSGVPSASPSPPPDTPQAGPSGVVHDVSPSSRKRAAEDEGDEGEGEGEQSGPSQIAAEQDRSSPSSPVPATTPTLARVAESTPSRLVSPRDGSPLSRTGTPTAPAPTAKGKKKYRASAVAQGNLTMLERQKDIVDYITSSGGFLEYSYTLNEDLVRFLRESRPDARQMDRVVLRQAFEACVDRELLRKTSVVGLKGQRHDVYYLPTVAPDSPELVQYLRDIASATRTYARGTHTNDIVLDEAFDVDDADVKLDSMVADPLPADGPEVARQFFGQQPLVVGRKYGVRQGLAARARQMHKWLASWLFRHADDAHLAVRRDDDGFVVAQKTILDQMPIGVYVRLVPLPFESEALDAFLAEPDNGQLSMSAAPADIVAVIRPHQPKRKAAMWKNFESLLHLRLLAPLIPHRSDPHEFEPSSRPKLATHWRFATTVPLYALGGDRALVDVCDLDSNDAVGEYWTALESASMRPSRDKAQREPIEDDRFPDKCTWIGQQVLRGGFIKADRWRDTYQLADRQRTFLVRLVQHDPGLATDADNRAEDLVKWAHALLAPVDVVKEYLFSTHHRLLDDLDAAAKSRRSRKKKVKVAEDGDDDEDDEIAVDEAVRKANAAKALHRKVQEASEQRERDWVGILERFRAEHDQPDLHAATVDWLHRAFLDPRRQIDAKHLDSELCRLLPAPDAGAVADGAPVAPPDPSFKSLVPLSIQKKAQAAKNPYAVSTNLPSLAKRVPKRKTKAQVRGRTQALARAQAAAAGEGDESARAKDAAAGPAETVDSGTQDEFLDVPVPPRPELEQGRRLTRNFYTPEQDDLILDAYAVLRARAHHLGARVNYRIFEDFFQGNKGSAIKQRAISILNNKPAMRAYFDRLVAEYLVVFDAEGRDVVHDPFPDSMTAFDLAGCVRFLRAKVNKAQIRLMRDVPTPAVQAAEVVPLPASLEQLFAQYTVNPLEASADTHRRFAKIHSSYHITAQLRLESIVNLPFGDSVVPSKLEPPIEWLHDLARGACKAIVATDEHLYDSAKGGALLAPFPEEVVEDVIKDLRAKSIMQTRKEDRRAPGAGLVYHDKFILRFESMTSVSRLREAADFDKDLHESGGTTFPLVPAEGDMLAFFELLSQGKVDLSVDASGLSAKALDYTDFGTRQANDDDIECAVSIVPKDPFEKVDLPLPDTLLPLGITFDEPTLASALGRLPADADLARIVELCVAAAGPDGSLPAFLERVAEDQAARTGLVADLPGAIALLTRSEPPLAFWAGKSSLRLVHARHVAQWALPLAVSAPAAAEGAGAVEQPPVGRWFPPAFWTDIEGRTNVEYWSRAVAWVKGELWKRSGSTCAAIVDRAMHKQVLVAHEVHTILRTLVAAGKVLRVEGALAHGEGEYDWERDHWELGGCVWR